MKFWFFFWYFFHLHMILGRSRRPVSLIFDPWTTLGGARAQWSESSVFTFCWGDFYSTIFLNIFLPILHRSYNTSQRKYPLFQEILLHFWTYQSVFFWVVTILTPLTWREMEKKSIFYENRENHGFLALFGPEPLKIFHKTFQKPQKTTKAP